MLCELLQTTVTAASYMPTRPIGSSPPTTAFVVTRIVSSERRSSTMGTETSTSRRIESARPRRSMNAQPKPRVSYRVVAPVLLLNLPRFDVILELPEAIAADLLGKLIPGAGAEISDYLANRSVDY